VGKSKTAAGTGLVIPLNATALTALSEHASWYIERFGECKPDWFVFAYGTPLPKDPTRSITSFKTGWTKVRKEAGVKGRWHDNRHTLVDRACRGWSWRRGDHEYRQTRVPRNALPLLTRAHGS
jgi:integrase